MTIAQPPDLSAAAPENLPPSPRRWKPMLYRGLLLLAALLLVAAVAGYFFLDGFLRFKIQADTAQALDRPTLLQSAHLDISTGRLTLEALSTENFAGYDSREFLSLHQGQVVLQTSSLLSHTVRVDEITLDGLHLIVEQNQEKNNLQEIIAAIRAKNARDPDHVPGKDLDIGVVRLVNTTLTIHFQNLPGFPTEAKTYALGPIEMRNVRSKNGRLLEISGLTLKVLGQIARTASDDPQIEPNVRSMLKTASAALDHDVGKTIRTLIRGLSVGG